MKAVWFGLFSAGALLFWGSAAAVLYRSRPLGIAERLKRFWRHASAEEAADWLPDETPPAEQSFLAKARLAGVKWSYRSYLWGRRGAMLAGVYLWIMAYFPDAAGSAGGVSWLRMLLGAAAAAAACRTIPDLALSVLAARRRGAVLAEISKFAHRMSICMTDQCDMRELILRAGRPLRVMRPHLQQLAAQWGNDRREAILAFKDAVGISEAYPLVNAFSSLSRAKSSDIKRLLKEHARAIDATLDAEMTKRIENAPIWISFYIMAPFLVCLALFVYPWAATVLEQLSYSFAM